MKHSVWRPVRNRTLRFADTAHAADASTAFTTQSINQSVDLQLAANEVSHRRAKLMQRSRLWSCTQLDFDGGIASKDLGVSNITPNAHTTITLAATVEVVSSG